MRTSSCWGQEIMTPLLLLQLHFCLCPTKEVRRWCNNYSLSMDLKKYNDASFVPAGTVTVVDEEGVNRMLVPLL